MDKHNRLRVFVSYARADGAALAEELATGLELLGFSALLDKHDIAVAEDWEQRLDVLIRQADTVLFLLSPRSVSSPRCAWEVERALSLSKRVLPVVAVPVAEAQVPEALRRLNFVDFSAGRSFTTSLGHLADALRVDLDWIREHTRLAELATRWAERGHDDALLLRGGELEAAAAWSARWQVGAPLPTDGQRALLAASTEAQALRESGERQRLQEMAQATQSRADALATREEALRALKRRTMIAGVATGALGLGLGAVALLYARAAREREAERVRADEAATRALEAAATREAMRTDLEGQVVAYSTLPGQLAWDDSDFTSGLLAQLNSAQVPLSVALSRTVRKVIDKTEGKQRPYIASDMNGDVYFRVAPPSRRRMALVVTVDHIDDMPLPGWHVTARRGATSSPPAASTCAGCATPAATKWWARCNRRGPPRRRCQHP